MSIRTALGVATLTAMAISAGTALAIPMYICYFPRLNEQYMMCPQGCDGCMRGATNIFTTFCTETHGTCREYGFDRDPCRSCNGICWRPRYWTIPDHKWLFPVFNKAEMDDDLTNCKQKETMVYCPDGQEGPVLGAYNDQGQATVAQAFGLILNLRYIFSDNPDVDAVFAFNQDTEPAQAYDDAENWELIWIFQIVGLMGLATPGPVNLPMWQYTEYIVAWELSELTPDAELAAALEAWHGGFPALMPSQVEDDLDWMKRFMYDSWDLIRFCTTTPVEPATWGRIKAQYR